MHAAHVAIAVFMGLCGLGALLALSGTAPKLIGISMFMGWWATVGAMVVAVVLAVVLAARISQGKGEAFIRRSWLGFANGIVAFAFWVWFIAYAS
jgi:hypothetical protein